MPCARSEVNADTVIFIPSKIDLPRVSVETALTQAATDIVSISANPPPHHCTKFDRWGLNSKCASPIGSNPGQDQQYGPIA